MNFQDKIKKFIDKKSEKEKIIVIYGPTACGKTSLSIDIAKMLDTEIISTDSRQIFKYMDIGTAKVTPEEMDGVRHHMIDFVEPNSEYSVGEFKSESEKIICKLHDNGKIPMLVGGTGLYIDSLIYDFDIPKVPADLELRAQLEKEAKEKGNDYIYNKLVEIDPDYAKELHPNNVQYVVRAIEVKTVSGKSKKDFRKDKKLKYDVLFITPYDEKITSRGWLYDRINLRVDIMFDSGLMDEINNLLKLGFKENDFGMKTIGYEEIMKYKNGVLSLEEAKELIKKNSRNYAKRQLTWFRKYE